MVFGHKATVVTLGQESLTTTDTLGKTSLYAQNTHKIILEDILKATGKLGRLPHKGHLPS